MALTIRIPKNTIYNKDRTKASALVTTVGTVYVNNLTTGALEAASASTTQTQKLWIANETIAAADNRLTVNCALVSPEDAIVADSVNNSDATHNGRRMILNATGDKVNNTADNATTAAVFTQVGVVGAAADKKIIVRLTV